MLWYVLLSFINEPGADSALKDITSKLGYAGSIKQLDLQSTPSIAATDENPAKPSTKDEIIKMNKLDQQSLYKWMYDYLNCRIY
jgi:hypothetical protein